MEMFVVIQSICSEFFFLLLFQTISFSCNELKATYFADQSNPHNYPLNGECIYRSQEKKERNSYSCVDITLAVSHLWVMMLFENKQTNKKFFMLRFIWKHLYLGLHPVAYTNYRHKGGRRHHYG